MYPNVLILGRESTKSRRRLGAALVCSLGLIGLLGLVACSIRPKASESRGPFLSIVQREVAVKPGASQVRRAIAPGAVALALGGLPSDALPRLRGYLKESTDGALRRAAPEDFDLDDVAPADSLRQALPNLPALTAATNLLGSPWEAPRISVQLAPVCDAAASRCVPLFVPVAAPRLSRAESDDALVRRGRALAWALGNAALLRVPATARAPLLHSLRQAQARPSGTLAMVFDAARGKLDEAELDLLHREARRLLADIAADSPQRFWLDALLGAQAEWQLPIALEADELLVVPRLSSMARLEDFVSEVERAGTFEWVVRPASRLPPP
jgi:hypothetical protein